MGRMKDKVIEYEESTRFRKTPTPEQLSWYDITMDSVSKKSSRLSVATKRKLLKNIAEII